MKYLRKPDRLDHVLRLSRVNHEIDASISRPHFILTAHDGPDSWIRVTWRRLYVAVLASAAMTIILDCCGLLQLYVSVRKMEGESLTGLMTPRTQPLTCIMLLQSLAGTFLLCWPWGFWPAMSSPAPTFPNHASLKGGAVADDELWLLPYTSTDKSYFGDFLWALCIEG